MSKVREEVVREHCKALLLVLQDCRPERYMPEFVRVLDELYAAAYHEAEQARTTYEAEAVRLRQQLRTAEAFHDVAVKERDHARLLYEKAMETIGILDAEATKARAERDAFLADDGSLTLAVEWGRRMEAALREVRVWLAYTADRGYRDPDNKIVNRLLAVIDTAISSGEAT